jgi:hypothetical protein
VREAFGGPITYVSVPFETVDWSRFDFVSVDLYRDARIRDRFTEVLQRYFAYERPVAIAEFGCCTYRGAADAGGRGFAILDTSALDRESTPPRLTGHYVRDEAEQARDLTETLSIFEAAGVDATFVMTFIAPLNPTSDDPLYHLVRSGAGRPRNASSASQAAAWASGPSRMRPWWRIHRRQASQARRSRTGSGPPFPAVAIPWSVWVGDAERPKPAAEAL